MLSKFENSKYTLGVVYFFVLVLAIINLFLVFQEIEMKNLIGKKVKIISDNENYDKFRDETLIITHASNSGLGYDASMYPEMLCDFKIKGKPSKEVPFALYEYEFEIL